MDVILVPGLWLDGASWERVVPPLEQAGHRVRPLTPVSYTHLTLPTKRIV